MHCMCMQIQPGSSFIGDWAFQPLDLITKFLLRHGFQATQAAKVVLFSKLAICQFHDAWCPSFMQIEKYVSHSIYVIINIYIYAWSMLKPMV